MASSASPTANLMFAALTLLAVASLAGCTTGTEDKIKEQLEATAGPRYSVHRCVEAGEDDGRTVYECFGETYTKSRRIGCYSLGGAEQVIEHECAPYRGD